MKLFSLFLFMISFGSMAQLETSNLTHDFGELYDNAPSYHDLDLRITVARLSFF